MEIWQKDFTLDILNNLSKGCMLEHMGITFTNIGDDYLMASMPITDKVTQPMGLLHGGASVALAESVASVAANMAAKEGLNVENIADIPYEDGANNPYVLVRKSFDSGDSVYYYYNANSAMGYSGTVNFSVLANSDAEVISFTYISGTEDSLGLSAARAISITSNNPYAEGSSIANYSAGATAQKTFPAIDTALDFIISDVQSIAGSVTPPEPETLETKITSLATSIDLGAVSDITEVTTEAALVDLKATFTAGGASYYYYEAHSEKGFSGSVEFALIINSESEIIGYKYLGGDE